MIEVLKTLYKKSVRMINGSLKGGFINYEMAENKAISLAIEALGKQTAKPPKQEDIHSHCPGCEYCFKEDDFLFCPQCGQKIDWP